MKGFVPNLEIWKSDYFFVKGRFLKDQSALTYLLLMHPWKMHPALYPLIFQGVEKGCIMNEWVK